MIRSCDKDELIGLKFGRLLVLSRGNSRHGRATWLCQCTCGKTKEVLGHNLKKGKTKSCGCIRKETAFNLINYAREGNYLSPGEAAFNVMFYTYKIHAQERSLSFDIDVDFFRQLTKGNCYYCGDEPKDLFKPKSPNGGYLGNGVDRINNILGYTTENSVPCCRVCNQMKSDRTYEQFVARCSRIARGHEAPVRSITE